MNYAHLLVMLVIAGLYFRLGGSKDLALPEAIFIRNGLISTESFLYQSGFNFWLTNSIIIGKGREDLTELNAGTKLIALG